ncbi:MAG: hypothetical protein Q8O35_01150 [Humidesulfovibrio sp.]|uniref:hypothetical protein n=1 Tax=Humidesulfovibrio sp. TaxID=2910988 RepID=UPI002732575C|nr:hypothetical protein [Humidesulfovibrio sp.]MDP2846778.1 hypothetical protein [Humidesulfovibrio sp.]
MIMLKIARKLVVPFLFTSLALSGAALAQDKAADHNAHAGQVQQGSKMMMDGCEMMKMDMDKGAKMMGDGHGMMMMGMKDMKSMSPEDKKKMMAADQKMMQGKKMMQDGMKMMMQGKEEMAKTHGGAAKHDTKP